MAATVDASGRIYVLSGSDETNASWDAYTYDPSLNPLSP
jgi:hypothetical protein